MAAHMSGVVLAMSATITRALCCANKALNVSELHRSEQETRYVYRQLPNVGCGAVLSCASAAGSGDIREHANRLCVAMAHMRGSAERNR